MTPRWAAARSVRYWGHRGSDTGWRPAGLRYQCTTDRYRGSDAGWRHAGLLLGRCATGRYRGSDAGWRQAGLRCQCTTDRYRGSDAGYILRS